ncbi:glutamate racemase [Paenibacillus sp. J31TS4]|uniref:glutamate racemase n=1 Tax=Paenibacillus sp. J31TS4 TaxID=2807195 RepID=UPI001B2776B9|nr:glutamate racemase [Paenibacillus sp. J31TS4]GIP38091.1 glutamate racemase [Paenibacillus sp. J31TS4]
MQHAIAILDSGVGGLTVAKEVMRQLPREKVVYFGDTARTPYGPRPAEQVIQFTRQIVDYLLQYKPKMIVIACNTATAVALEDIRSRVSVPVVGVIHPGARAAIKTTRSGRVGVIGTEGTIRSGAYETALREISPQLQVVSMACPSFVPIVEQGRYEDDIAREEVKHVLRPFREEHLDCLILGCTHYPYLTGAIREAMGPSVALISSADETAREISTILYHNGQLAQSNQEPVHQFFCSGDPHLFRSIAQSWLKEEIQVTPVVWRVPTIS